MKNIFYIIALTLLIASCRSRHIVTEPVVSHEFLDTIIYIDSLDFLIAGEHTELHWDDAQKALKDHFYKLGYYNEKDSAKTRWGRGDIWCADVDTVWPVYLNGDRFIDAVIEYEDAPCMANGHCIMPHKGIVAYINGKYRFIGRDFLLSRFYMDSIKAGPAGIVIYGAEYDCGQHENIRNYRALIKQKL
jgi:hypothetical protein